MFNLTLPKNAYFGKKDAQQLALIQQMVKNLFLPINIIACDIVRESSGLALSSRNVYLTPEQKEEALKISKSIYMAGNLIAKGERDSKIVKDKIYEILENLDVEYVRVVNKRFDEIEKIEVVETPKEVVVVSKNEIISNTGAANTLFAIPIVNGYKLVNDKPETIFILKKTSADNIFIAQKDSKSGVLMKKSSGWFFEYYEGDKLFSEKVEVKF